jgi:coproporphyrinogen III oxidase-like Fe-S oxidoreductase
VLRKKTDSPQEFSGYCTRETTGQVYAFGATGISQLESVYAQNEKKPDRYVEIINQGKFTVEKGYQLSTPEKIIRHVINEIMCNEYVSFEETAENSIPQWKDKKCPALRYKGVLPGICNRRITRNSGNRKFPYYRKQVVFSSGT